MDTTVRSGAPGALSSSALANTIATRPAAPANALVPVEANTSSDTKTLALAAAAPARTGIRWNSNTQGNVARAQQALDYLERVASELEALKASLSAKLSGSRGGARELDAQVRKLAASISSRSTQGGGGVDARLRFTDGQVARQEFRITGLEPGVVQAAAPLTLALSIGGAQVSASFDADMTPEQIAAQLDRAMAPVNVRAGLSGEGRLVFSTDETSWPAVRENIVLSGRGRAHAEAVVPDPNLQELQVGNPDALRQSLREVVQALERVRLSQAAASAALNAAAAEMVEPQIDPQALAMTAQDFAAVAGSHDYQSLLAITSALAGVSRERVVALLGLG